MNAPSEERRRWCAVAIDRIVCDLSRTVDEAHVAHLAESYARLGGQLMLQPILLDERYRLIDGVHRLEAAKRSGWSRIPALVCRGLDRAQWPLIEIEANRVRRVPSPLELESVWRAHYEPELRAAARKRKLAGLRQGNKRPVIGNTENGNRPLSLARAAKQFTGLSIETLRKVSELRGFAIDESLNPAVRELAEESLRSLALPGASVESHYRALKHATHQAGADLFKQDGTPSATELGLDRILEDTTRLYVRLRGKYGTELEWLVAQNESTREQLRAVRVALARSLATVVSIECRLEHDRTAALRRLGREVSHLLSHTSAEQLGIGGRTQ